LCGLGGAFLGSGVGVGGFTSAPVGGFVTGGAGVPFIGRSALVGRGGFAASSFPVSGVLPSGVRSGTVTGATTPRPTPRATPRPTTRP
jgi:hypothetical protein